MCPRTGNYPAERIRYFHAVFLKWNGVNVLSINEKHARFRVVKVQQEIYQCGFPISGAPMIASVVPAGTCRVMSFKVGRCDRGG